jgi:hypothetical protein
MHSGSNKASNYDSYEHEEISSHEYQQWQSIKLNMLKIKRLSHMKMEQLCLNGKRLMMIQRSFIYIIMFKIGNLFSAHPRSTIILSNILAINNLEPQKEKSKT